MLLDGSDMPAISHDLQSALTDVMNGLYLVDTEKLDPDNRTHIDRARASGDMLARLLDTLAKNLRGYAEPSAFDRGALSLRALLDELQARWAPRARETGLGFSLQKSPNLPEFIAMDRVSLERVLSNIIENALKYSHLGDVRFSVVLEKDRTLVFRVCDTGPGFGQVDQESLFAPSARTGDLHIEGSGMGLFIVKHLTEMMGGTVSLNDKATGGAVTVRFPQTTWDIARSLVPDNESFATLSGLSVLLAEDNQTSQMLLERMIKALGGDVMVANDGREAQTIFQNNHVDIAFLDVEMPHISGFELIREIRASSGTKSKIPIIAVTAYIMPDHAKKLAQIGANGTIQKPITDVSEFGRKIRNILSNGPVAHPEPNKAIAKTGIVDEGVFAELKAAVGEDALPRLLTKVIDDLHNVKSAIDAALEAMDCKVIRVQTHVLISVAGAIGARDLQLRAQLLNQSANDADRAAVRREAVDCLANLDEVLAEMDTRRTSANAEHAAPI